MSEDKKYKQLSKKDKIPLKYAAVHPDVRQHISKILDGMGNAEELRGHIDDLYKLIDWQKERTVRQEKQIIAVKHLEAWKQYEVVNNKKMG